MKLRVFEIIALVAGVIALILIIAAMAVPNWLQYGNLQFGLFKACSSVCIDYANLNIPQKSFLQATAAFVTLALIFNVVGLVVLVLFMFINKFRTNIFKIVAIVAFAVAGVCAIIGFAVFLGKWKEVGVPTSWFGPGPWLTLVSAIFSFVACIFCVLFKYDVD